MTTASYSPRSGYRGEPAGFAKVAAPMMTRAMTRANRKDLEQLNAILERRPERAG